MASRKRILWLVSWYPNKHNPFDGDFVQRHARAAALFCDVYVLFVTACRQQHGIEETTETSGALTERIIYLPKRNGLRGKVENNFRWQEVYRKAINETVREFGPALVHVHVPWKAGLLALWAKMNFRLPYVVTEHWGIYNRVVDDSVYKRSALFRRLLRRIYSESAAFLSVSEYVGHGVNRAMLSIPFAVVPNVVDTNVFHWQKEKRKRFTFLHVSNMVPLKNVEGILLAFYQFLKTTAVDAQLVLVGNKDKFYEDLATKMGLQNTSVFFRGEVPYAQVAEEMKQSHAFVLNSDIENSPCVIGEALCCGLPVIATAVGGVPELLDASNGVLVQKESASLAQAMQLLFETYSRYDGRSIAAAAESKFSMSTVGRAFAKHYNAISEGGAEATALKA